MNCVDLITDCTPQCNVVRVDNLQGKNICTTGNYKCSPPPIRITDIKVNGLWYACRNDANKGQCNGRPGGEAVPTSCVSLFMRWESNSFTYSKALKTNALEQPAQCRNDGKRNFREGRIRRAEYEAIEQRNAELDVELAEFLAKQRA